MGVFCHIGAWIKNLSRQDVPATVTDHDETPAAPMAPNGFIIDIVGRSPMTRWINPY
jgi:hypothetical protein